MSDSVKARVAGSSIGGMTICQILWPAEKYTLEILRLLGTCPHQRRLRQALGLNEDDATTAQYAALQTRGLTFVVDTGRRLTALVHLIPDLDSSPQGGSGAWEMDAVILDEEADPGTLDALLEGVRRLNPFPMERLSTRIAAESEAVVLALRMRGFAVEGTECMALTACCPMQEPDGDPQLRVFPYLGGQHLPEEVDRMGSWLLEILSPLDESDPSGKTRAACARALQRAVANPDSTILVARGEGDVPVGILSYRIWNPLLGVRDGSAAVIEVVEALCHDQREVVMQRLHQQALHRLYEEGLSQALFCTTQPANENVRQTRVSRLRQLNLLRQLGYQLLSARVLLAHRPERFVFQPELNITARREAPPLHRRVASFSDDCAVSRRDEPFQVDFLATRP